MKLPSPDISFFIRTAHEAGLTRATVKQILKSHTLIPVLPESVFERNLLEKFKPGRKTQQEFMELFQQMLHQASPSDELGTADRYAIQRLNRLFSNSKTSGRQEQTDRELFETLNEKDISWMIMVAKYLEQGLYHGWYLRLEFEERFRMVFAINRLTKLFQLQQAQTNEVRMTRLGKEKISPLVDMDVEAISTLMTRAREFGMAWLTKPHLDTERQTLEETDHALLLEDRQLESHYREAQADAYLPPTEEDVRRHTSTRLEPAQMKAEGLTEIVGDLIRFFWKENYDRLKKVLQHHLHAPDKKAVLETLAEIQELIAHLTGQELKSLVDAPGSLFSLGYHAYLHVREKKLCALQTKPAAEKISADVQFEYREIVSAERLKVVLAETLQFLEEHPGHSTSLDQLVVHLNKLLEPNLHLLHDTASAWSDVRMTRDEDVALQRRVKLTPEHRHALILNLTQRRVAIEQERKQIALDRGALQEFDALGISMGDAQLTFLRGAQYLGNDLKRPHETPVGLYLIKSLLVALDMMNHAPEGGRSQFKLLSLLDPKRLHARVYNFKRLDRQGEITESIQGVHVEGSRVFFAGMLAIYLMEQHRLPRQEEPELVE